MAFWKEGKETRACFFILVFEVNVKDVLLCVCVKVERIENVDLALSFSYRKKEAGNACLLYIFDRVCAYLHKRGVSLLTRNVDPVV